MEEITLQQKQEWMITCLKASAELYGIVPWKILRRLYRKRFKLTEEEIIEVFRSIDEETRGFVEYEGDVVDAALAGTEAYTMMKGYQEGKPYFIPNEKEIITIAENGFQNDTAEAKMMLKAIKDFITSDEDEAADILYFMQRKLSMNCMPTKLLEEIKSAYGKEAAFEDEHDIQDFFEVMMYFNNNCRMIIHKGNTPKWLSQNPGIGVF